MIAVVDYGVANIGSMLNMLRKVGATAVAASTAEAVHGADKIILPGVGAFDNGMAALHGLGLVDALRERALHARVPFLGVCLGMQLLGDSSEEGSAAGLGLIAGRSLRLRPPVDSRLKVPHMGWNTVRATRATPLLNGDDDARFYFVHSYHLHCADPADVLGTSQYGETFTSMVQRGNITGTQFHPEKSHRYGMELLRQFAGA